MKIEYLDVRSLAPNTGQIPGLPANPREWRLADVDSIAASLRETPELFEARPLLVVPFQGSFVILGGNLRFEGALKNEATTVPAIVFPEETPVSKLKEIVVKDNGNFGAWDYDALANEWDDLPLSEWGVPVWDTTHQEGEGGQQPGAPQPTAKTSDTRTLEIDGLTPDEFDFVKSKLSAAGESDREGLLNLLGYGEI